METTFSKSDLRQLLLVALASRAASVVTFLASVGAVAARDGVVKAWMCIAAFAVFYSAVSTVQQGRGWASRLAVCVASDVVLTLALLAADVGRFALTALAVHYVLYYARIALARAVFAALNNRAA